MAAEVGLGWADRATLGLALLAPVVLLLLWWRDVIRPGSLRRCGVRDVSAWPWWLWLIAGFAVWVAGAIGAGLAIQLGDALIEDPDRTTEAAIMTLGFGVFGIAAALLMLELARQHARDVHRAGLTLRSRWSEVRLGLLAFVLAMPIVQGVSVVSIQIYIQVMGRYPDALAHETLEALHAEPGNPAVWMLIVGAVVAAPIIEEIVFRIFMQSALIRLTGRVWPSVVVTSAIFALVHIGAGVDTEHWHAIPTLFALGVAMGIAYEWTRRPVVPIVIHMAFNGYNVALVMVGAV